MSVFRKSFMRGALYVTIAIAIDLRENLKLLTPEHLAQFTWVDGANIFLGAFLAGAIVLRGFLDNTVARAGGIKPSEVQPTKE